MLNLIETHKTSHPQGGFGLLLLIVVLVVIAGLWVATQQEKAVSIFKTQAVESDYQDLKQVKARLLEFAMLQPEIYLTNTSSQIQSANQIPSPGYFPCPDLDGDGTLSSAESSCTNPFLSTNTEFTGFVPDFSSASPLGFVPQAITTRNTYFAPAGRYYYFLDERFSNQNPNYVNDNLKRYAPLNPVRLEGAVLSASDKLDSFTPVLTLNGQAGYIALIIDAGTDGLDAANADGDRHFVSGSSSLFNDDNADKIVGVTYTEWFALVGSRICYEQARFKVGLDGAQPIDEDLRHWYNNYNLTSNPGGGSWRSLEVTCAN